MQVCAGISMGWQESQRRVRLTTLRVPTSTFGGAFSAATISEMKLAVMPMMEMRDTACMPLTTVKVAPRAPKVGAGMANVVEDFGFEGYVLDDKSVLVRRARRVQKGAPQRGKFE
jgi:hypothetical protein